VQNQRSDIDAAVQSNLTGELSSASAINWASLKSLETTLDSKSGIGKQLDDHICMQESYRRCTCIIPLFVL